MSTTIDIEPVSRTIHVKAPIAHAFDVFTMGLARWWPQGCGIGNRPIAKMMMEPKLDGRWLEIAEDGTETVVATIIAWDRPHRLVLLWQVNAKWQPDATMKSEVEVSFTATGAGSTSVTLLHHRFETMGPDDGASMRKDVSGGWPGHMDRFAAEAERSFS